MSQITKYDTGSRTINALVHPVMKVWDFLRLLCPKNLLCATKFLPFAIRQSSGIVQASPCRDFVDFAYENDL